MGSVAEDPVVLQTIAGSVLMPGDPRECRRHALRCAELAVSARSEQLKAALLELSKNWEHLAIDLENGTATIDEVEVVSSMVRRSLDDLTAFPKSLYLNKSQASVVKNNLRQVGTASAAEIVEFVGELTLAIGRSRRTSRTAEPKCCAGLASDMKRLDLRCVPEGR
jgi:hypothetical protein